MKISRQDIILAMKVYCLHLEAGQSILKSELIQDKNIYRLIDILGGNPVPPSPVVDKDTLGLILHFQQIIALANETGAVFSDFINPTLKSEWATLNTISIETRRQLRLVAISLTSGESPTESLNNIFWTNDFKELREQNPLPELAWDYLPGLLSVGASMHCYIDFLIGDDQF